MSSEENRKIDVSNYVALGDSVTSGYTDGALFYNGQQYAYANLLAQQFKLMGGTDFKQPLMKKESVGVGFLGNSRIVLKRLPDYSGSMALVPSFISPVGDLSAFSENIFYAQGPFNNMSVPAVKIISLEIPGLGNPKNGPGNYNPFFHRMASDPANSSVLADAIALNPSFFTLFIGNNDVLAFALSGGLVDAVTPPVSFESNLRSAINALTRNGAKGAIANLPDITSIPHFIAIPYNGLILDEMRATFLNTLYKPSGLNFQEGRNPFVLSDPLEGPQGVRQIKKGELLLLSINFDPEKINYLTGNTPIPKKYYLTISEIEKIQKTITSFNQYIKHIARVKRLGFVNVNLFIKKLRPEIVFDEAGLNPKYKKGNIFSLDGIHLTPFGQSVLANLFIKAINYIYRSDIKRIKSIKFKGIRFY